jgi:hypothetical protein
MDRATGRIGFMSTQRRENRLRRTSCTGVSGISFSGSNVRLGYAIASGGTAPPDFLVWLATISLLSGYRIVQLVQSVQLIQLVQSVQLVQPVQILRQDLLRHCGSPFGSGSGAKTGRSANHGFPPPPTLSCLARLHPNLPQVPVGRRRWTERYDGKGNLHLLHAA